MKAPVGIFLAGFLGVAAYPLFAQARTGPVEAAAQDTPYLIPPTLFVGDLGRLVVPLGPGAGDFAPLVVESDRLISFAPDGDLVIRRLELENRGGQGRLLIDFVAYAPGFLTLPDLPLPELHSQGLSTAGFQVGIASLLTKEPYVLAEPLPPLVMPGTTVLMYGCTAGILGILLGALPFRVWGKTHLRGLRERLRRRRLIRALKRLLRKVEKGLAGERPEALLRDLSQSLRQWLGFFTGLPCTAMDAGELRRLPPFLPSGFPKEEPGILSGSFFCGLFRRCDALRFSGGPIPREEVQGMLRELRRFAHTLDQADRERNRRDLLPFRKGQGAA
ncbi:MAG: hypothetical protein LBD74_04775 [Spirochaetaceae bacterium]|jgi:hypothetical protein|nr:hypothetical protein [Spirochaetaceae bacterium]